MSGTGATPDAPGSAPPTGSPEGREDANLASRALRGGMLVVGSKFLLQGFTWASTLLVIRLLEPADYGLVAAAFFIVGFAQLIADGGLTRALVQRPALEQNECAVAFTISTIVSVAFYTAIWFAAEPIARYSGTPQLAPMMQVMGLTLFIPIFHVVPDAMLERKLQYPTIAMATTASTFGQAAITLGLAWQGWGLGRSALESLPAKSSMRSGSISRSPGKWSSHGQTRRAENSWASA